MRNRWLEWPRLGSEERAAARKLGETWAMPGAVAEWLWQRGFRSAEQIAGLWSERLEASDPFALPDMEVAAALLQRAVTQGKRIRIYGDYDADGVTAVAVMLRGLRAWAGDALRDRLDYAIPNRFDEGYGLNVDAVEAAHAAGVDLLITVDCGSSSPEAARLAKHLGLSLIITDHHALPERLPEADALVNPERMPSPNRLSGAGVALWTLRALYGGEVPDVLWAIAAIGTVADVVPLLGDNRTLVRRGLAALARGEVPGVTRLMEGLGGQSGFMEESDIGFRVAPHLNAAGRLGDADPAVDLLLADDFAAAGSIADRLIVLNRERRAIERQVLAEAWERLPRVGGGRLPGFVVVSGSGWHEGVVGIVAARLRETLRRPTAVVAFDPLRGGIGKGSARGVPGFHLIQHMRRYQDRFVALGGHSGAAGFSVAGDPEELGMELSELLSPDLGRDAEDFRYGGEAIDIQVPPSGLEAALVDWLDRLRPYGKGFEAPRLWCHGPVEQWDALGKEGQHLRYWWQGSRMKGLSFGDGALAGVLRTGDILGATGRIEWNVWQGRRNPEWHADRLYTASGATARPFSVLWKRPTLDDWRQFQGLSVVIVDSDRDTVRLARQFPEAVAYHWALSRGDLRLLEETVRTAENSILVLNQWRPLPEKLAGCAQRLVWWTPPRHREVFWVAATLLGDAGAIWCPPQRTPAEQRRVVAKVERLVPGRDRLGRLWKDLGNARSGLTPGRRVFEELHLTPDQRLDGERRSLSDSFLYQLGLTERRLVLHDAESSPGSWVTGSAVDEQASG